MFTDEMIHTLFRSDIIRPHMNCYVVCLPDTNMYQLVVTKFGSHG